jgi:N,N'-diacetyllegionaminate synthase
MKKNDRVIIIAEAGQNHNGKLQLAYKLVNAAKKCGADFVKFQTSIPELHISRFARKANYQVINAPNSKTQLEMSKKTALSYEDFKKINKYCSKKKINFLSTPAEIKSINFLNSLKMKYFKVPSGEITNLLYLKKIASLRKKIILSTGMSNMKEIRSALKILTSNGNSKKNITVLQCNTEYPTPMVDANIKAITSIKNFFNVNVGYSDHTAGIEASLAAVALGAKIIEKHITINKNLPGPDHKASINPKEFSKMVRYIRNITTALGSGIKKVTQSELKNIKIVRTSIVAAREIKKGEKFSKKNLTIKRPGTGISPMKFYKIIGKTALKNFSEDEIIKL